MAASEPSRRSARCRLSVPPIDMPAPGGKIFVNADRLSVGGWRRLCLIPRQDGWWGALIATDGPPEGGLARRRARARTRAPAAKLTVLLRIDVTEMGVRLARLSLPSSTAEAAAWSREQLASSPPVSRRILPRLGEYWERRIFPEILSEIRSRS